MSHGEPRQSPSLLERVDLALASRLVRAVGDEEPVATAQRMLADVRRPTAADAGFLASLLRLRGFVIDDDDAVDVLRGRPGRLAPITQEYRMLAGLRDCLRLVRWRATEGTPPDGQFVVELFRAMTAELPRFRNNDLRRGSPWDAQLYVSYPAPDLLRNLIATFDQARSYRDMPQVFATLHPVRQGFRVLWRFARIAPFPDFNVLMAWLAMNAWLLVKGYPLLAAEDGDQELMARTISGPPPSKILQLEQRLLRCVDG